METINKCFTTVRLTMMIFIYFTIISLTLLHSSLAQKEDESFEDDLVPVTHILPKQIFNEGKPFYVDKDPISGQLDFSSKKPAGIEPEINEVIDTQLKTVILNSISPNIHDYLNLPVKYSSSKFVYPLVSSSYANLKYQGNNKNYMSHHKETIGSTSTTTSPKYYTFKKTTNAAGKFTPTTTLHQTTNFTPTTTKSSVKIINPSISTSTEPPMVTSTTQQKKVLPSKGHVTSTTFSTSTIKIEPTKKLTTAKTTISSTIKLSTPTTTQKPTTSKTLPIKKIIIPVKRNFTQTTPAIKTTTTQIKTTTTTAATTTTTTNRPSTTVSTTTTLRPNTTLSTTKTSTTAHSTTTTKISEPAIDEYNFNKFSDFKNVNIPSLPTFSSSTERPNLFTNEPSAFRPMPTSTTVFPTLSPASVYNELSHKKESDKLSLADLFNALAEEDFSYMPSGQEYGDNENLPQGFLSSKPAPFTLQKLTMNENNFNNTWQVRNQTVSSVLPEIPSNYSNTESGQINYQTGIADDQKEYVHYEIQQPTMVQQYRPAPSTNNVVISPDQNSASFVLGSQQSVQSNTYMGTVDKVPLFDNENYNGRYPGESFQFQKFNESQNYSHPPENLGYTNQGWISSQSLTSSINFSDDQEPNKNSQSNNNPIKFPNEEDKFSRPHGDLTNHEMHNDQKISFPKDEGLNKPHHDLRNPENTHNVVFMENNGPQFGSLDSQQVEPKKEVLTLNKYNLQKKVNIPALSEDLTPPALPEFEQKTHPHSLPLHHRHDDFNRKKFVPSSSRPKVNHSLPNILPQFRPNAKISTGHSTYNKEPGNFRITHHKLRYPHRSLPPPLHSPPSQYNRMPIGTHLNVKMIGNDDGNRRIFSVPVPTPPLHLHIVDRMFLKRPIVNQYPTLGFHESYSPRKSYEPNLEPHKHTEITEKLFVEDDQIVEDPPVPQQEKEKQPQKFEPVITLQMMKTQKKTPTQTKLDDSVTDMKILDAPQSPVYVVYPVKSSFAQEGGTLAGAGLDDSVAMDTKLEKSRRPSIDYSYSDFEYQNTQPQEPVLMKVKEKPLYIHGKPDFPYRLERPNPQIDRYDDSNFEMDLMPKIMNRGDIEKKQDAYMNTEIPIAVAYTPTESNLYYPNHKNHNNDNINELQTNEKKYENDFMAPFFPSMSLGAITNSPNSWLIHSTSTEKYNDKNYINRADIGNSGQNMGLSDFESSTKRFDLDRFQPELQGGFKPIYPPGYKSQSSSEERESEEVQSSVINSSNSSLSTTTTTQQQQQQQQQQEQQKQQQLPQQIETSTNSNLVNSKPTKTERKKSKLEASIESLLFGDDEDFEDDDETGDVVGTVGKEEINVKDTKDNSKS